VLSAHAAASLLGGYKVVLGLAGSAAAVMRNMRRRENVGGSYQNEWGSSASVIVCGGGRGR
jgi:hypothetical protein